MNEIGRKSLADVFGLPELKAAVTRVFEPGPLTPAVDPHYEFTPEQARLLMLWESGITKKKGLLISGPTDCGKSSGIEQFAARTGRQLFRIGCHGKMEWQEVMGTLQFKADGSTYHVAGPVPMAAKEGGILIFEEINFLPPNTVGAANTLLDGGAVTISETGEVIVPDKDFRICATANAIDQGDDAVLYRGTQTMNKALLRRFLTSRAGYLDMAREAALLHRVAPKLPGQLITHLVEAATDIRKRFLSGDLETVLGHSFMCDLARLMEARLPKLLDKGNQVVEEELAMLMKFNGLDAAPMDDANAIVETIKSKTAGRTYAFSTAPTVPPATPSPATTQRSTKIKPAQVDTTLTLLVNPARQGQGATPTIAFWAMAEFDGASTAPSWNGTLQPSLTTRRAADKRVTALQQTQSEKRNQRGYVVGHTVRTDGSASDATLKAALGALQGLFAGRDVDVSQSDVYELVHGILLGWAQVQGQRQANSAGIVLSATVGKLT